MKPILIFSWANAVPVIGRTAAAAPAAAMKCRRLSFAMDVSCYVFG
jgi:hypothetical protein